MKIRKTWGVVIGAVALLALAACGGSSDSASDTATEDEATVTAGEDITIAVITHGDDGVFWSVAQKGAEAAAAALGITLRYQGANNNAQDQAQMIEQAVTDGVQGIPEGIAVGQS